MWKVCNRFSTPQAISCWAWTCAGTFGTCKIPFSAKGSPMRSWRWQRTAAWNWQSITLPFCTFAASLVDQMKCCPTSESEYCLAILFLLCSCNVRPRKFELTRQAAQLVQSRSLAPGTHQFCAPLPGLQPPFTQSLWLTSEQFFVSIYLVPAENSNKSFVTETMVLKAWLTKRQRQVTLMWFIKIVFEISLAGRSIEGWFFSCTNAMGSVQQEGGIHWMAWGHGWRLHFLCGWLHFCHSTTIQHFLCFQHEWNVWNPRIVWGSFRFLCKLLSQCHSKDRAICSKNLPLVLKFMRRADAVRRPFELHLARVIEWPASLEQAIHTGVGRVRDYDPGSGPKVDPADPEENSGYGQAHQQYSAGDPWASAQWGFMHGWGLQAQGSRLWAVFVSELRASLKIIVTSYQSCLRDGFNVEKFLSCLRARHRHALPDMAWLNPALPQEPLQKKGCYIPAHLPDEQLSIFQSCKQLGFSLPCFVCSSFCIQVPPIECCSFWPCSILALWWFDA